LAVGDIFFQQKCYDRIKDYVEEGTTLLFVSHSMNTIIHLCDRTVLLKAGRIAFDGASKSAIDLYRAYQIVHRDIANKTPEAQKPVLDTNCTMSDIHSNEACRDVEIVHRLGSVATRAVYLKKIWLEDEKKSTKESVISGSVISICMTFMINHTIQDPNVGFDIRNKYGLVIFESNSHCMNESIEKLEVKQKITARFQVRLNLFPDDYTISVGFANGGYKNIKSRIALLYLPNVLAFTVIHDLDAPRWCGVVNLAPKFHYAISA
jgi:lipopolysaccharide transport system ATP-binding protein